jgi:hypothetical protein
MVSVEAAMKTKTLPVRQEWGPSLYPVACYFIELSRSMRSQFSFFFLTSQNTRTSLLQFHMHVIFPNVFLGLEVFSVCAVNCTSALFHLLLMH